MEEKNKEAQLPQTIDLAPLLLGFLRQLKRLWWLVVLLAVLGGGLSWLRASRQYVPMYRAEAMLTATISTGSTTDLITSTYRYNNEAAQQAAGTFPALLGSDAMTERLKLALGTDRINGSISTTSVAGTNFLVLSVTSSNPQDAYDILCAVLEVYPQVSRLVIGDTQLAIAAEPSVPTEAYNPFSWKRPALTGALTGTALACVLLLLLAPLNQTLTSSKDVQKLLNLSCLAEIPYIRPKRRSRKDRQPLLLITTQDTDSAFCEAIRLLRLKLLRHMTNPSKKVILVTSTLPSEGKSSVAINTALSLARDGKKVLLIDSDLRAQNIKNLLGIHDKSTGLMELLNQSTNEIRFIPYRDTSLYLLAGDRTCTDPTPLLKYDVLQVVMNTLRPRFDYIILDTPPCGMMADAAALAAHCDKILYVVREDFVTRAQLVDSIYALTSANTEICGFVMNRSTESHGGRYGYGYGKYGYGYKYGAYSSKYGKSAYSAKPNGQKPNEP